MPSVQSLISLATLASPAAALETTDQFELSCATDGHEEVDVLQTSLEETSTASTASSDVTGSIFATYSKTNTTNVPTLEFDLDVSGMVTKLTASAQGTETSLQSPYNEFKFGEFSTSTSPVTSPVITWAIYQENIIGNGNWAFGSECDVKTNSPVFDSAPFQTVLPGLEIAGSGTIYTIKYELEIPVGEKVEANAAIALFLESALPETIVLMANSNPLFCAKLFSTTGVKNGAGHFVNADGDFVDPSGDQ